MKLMKVGIITADIVESTEIDFKLREKLFNEFNKGIESLKESFHIEYEWYRGDAFQVKTKDCLSSLRVALLIKFWIKSFEKEAKKSYDIRLSLGLGKIEINKSQLALS